MIQSIISLSLNELSIKLHAREISCVELCSFAIGTDTSFSVVGCATENGVVGFKPAIGTISTEGVIPITAAFDEIGFLHVI